MNRIQTGTTSYEERLQSIYVVNLSYLLLAQRLIKQDKYAASFSLGMNEELIDIVNNLPLPQLIRLASTDRLICQLRIEDAGILNLVTRRSRLDALQGVHVGIILSTNLLMAAEKNEGESRASDLAIHPSSAAKNSGSRHNIDTLLAL